MARGVSGGVPASEDELEGKQMPLSTEMWDMECLSDNWRVRVGFVREVEEMEEVEQEKDVELGMALFTWSWALLTVSMFGC